MDSTATLPARVSPIVKYWRIEREPIGRLNWPLARSQFLLKTSRPGVFAVGDVRAGNINRVASAVGEGSTAFVHQVLQRA
jgi:hypothetical protein